MSTLWSLQAGDTAKIVTFNDELPANYKARLTELGFHPGNEVNCHKSPGMGAPKVYRVSNTFYSLDDKIAKHITIQLAE
jgi:Fe2+ transport system protein FeoA